MIYIGRARSIREEPLCKVHPNSISKRISSPSKVEKWRNDQEVVEDSTFGCRVGCARLCVAHWEEAVAAFERGVALDQNNKEMVQP